jgi:succinate-semialdehyde dehydrogenase/glutarate-semialdehyde dehydrogenase
MAERQLARCAAVTDPASGAMVGAVPDCTAADTQEAIEAADAAWAAWKARTAGERCALLESWHALVLANPTIWPGS